MKNIFLSCLLLLFQSAAFAQGFTVEKLTVDILLSKEGYFDVVENYDVNFSENKHGIFRDIITQFDYKDENDKVSKREIYISNIEVPNWKFKTNEIFGQLFNDKLSIRIGDKRQYVNGQQHYEIRYRVKNAVFFTNDEAQLYWNVKTAEWLAVFNQIDINIQTPEGTNLSSDNCFLYSGNTGNTELSQDFNYEIAENTFTARSLKDFYSYPGQNVTVLIKLPKDVILQNDFTKPFWERHAWLKILGLIILSIIAYIFLKLRLNKVTPITSYYPPEGLDPAMAGVLIDNLTNTRDITCLLPYWATKGIIRIEDHPKGESSLYNSLKLIKLKELPEDSAGYEVNLFNKIFLGRTEVMTSNLQGVFAEALKLLNNKSKQYYTANNKGLKIFVLVLSWVWAFFSISFFPFLIQPYVDIESAKFIAFVMINYIFFFLIFPILFAYFSNKLKAKTNRGKEIMAELLGFKQFIKLADADRIKTLLKEDPLYFEKTMPYAVAFNLLKEWTAKFEGLLTQAPSWYSNKSGTPITMNAFSSSFSRSMATAQTSMVSSPSRGSSSSSHSGGGSSGGGAGRGGGASW